MEKFCLKVSV